MAPPPLDPSLGLPVSTREFSLFELVSRAWGSEFFAPDHRVYQFGGVRFFDSTDMGYTGIYSPGLSQATPPVLNVTSDPINPTALTLTWTLSSVYGSVIDYYQIFRGVDGGAFTLLVSLGYEKDFTTYTDSSLNPSSVYGYYVVAVPDVGTSTSSNMVMVAQATAPALSGMVIGTTEIDLSWTASTVPGSTIQNYFVYRQIDGGGFTLLTTTGGGTLSFPDTTVSAGHTYDYYVVAHPASGFNSPQSNTVTETISGSVAWTFRGIQFGGNRSRNLGYGNGVVIATDFGNAYRSVDDGISWTQVITGSSVFLNQVAYGNGRWIIVSFIGGGNTFVIQSDDQGLTWGSPIALPVLLVNGICIGTDNAGHWVVGGGNGAGNTVNNYAVSSDNGNTWSLPGISVASAFYSIIWDGVRFVANTRNGPGTQQVATSTDHGQSWTFTTLSVTTPNFVVGIHFDATSGLYVVGANDVDVVRAAATPAGLGAAPDTNDSLTDGGSTAVVGGNGRLWVFGSAGSVAGSTDGVTWTPSNLNFSPAGDSAQSSVYDPVNRIFVAAGDEGNVSTYP